MERAVNGVRRSPWAMARGLFEKISRSDPQDLGNPAKIQDGNVPFAPLDRADESPMKSALVAELLLGKTPLFALFSHARPEPLEELLVFDVRHS